MADDESGLALHGALWLTVGGAPFGNGGRMALLAAVGEHGSITRAAKAVGLSYKAAWDAVDAMNNLAGEALVERLSGGKGGGGTRLTPRGRQLLDNFGLIEREHRRFIARLGARANGVGDDVSLIGRMGMKTSARNQFLGRVARVTRGAVNDEVELRVTGGHGIVAIVTRDSTDSLGLAPGVDAFALIEAGAVVLVADGGGARFSARNQLAGTIARVHPGAVNCEVVVELPGGATLTAMVTNAASETLGLAVGQPTLAIFKAASVILGVAA